MADLVDAARLLWCNGLPLTNGRPTKSIHEWLASGTFAPLVEGRSLVLEGINQADVRMALGFDINRLTSAASETLRNVVEIPAAPKSLGWPYVKLYYSALFYAHSLLRLWGRSPSYLRTTDLLHVRDTAIAYGVLSPFPLNTGQYMLTADLARSRVTMAVDRNSGGSHDALWRELAKALSDLKSALTTAPFLTADKVTIASQLDRGIALLTKGGASVAWPSVMRNDINYRQTEGVWYPYKGRAKTAELFVEIRNVLDGSISIPTLVSATGDDLLVFRSACLFVIALGRQSVSDLAAISGPRSFLKYGQAQFETAYP